MSEAFVVVRSEQGAVLELPTQLRVLTRLIEREPDVPLHYVLRGETWLMYGYLDHAREDFLAARRLAVDVATASGWGYLAQAYVDRAEAGLRRCSVDI